MLKMGKIISLLLSVYLILLLASDLSLAQGHSSARILSLGGRYVSGIIPDFYTDLYINPAYSSIAEGLTLNYGQRNVPIVRFPFPSLRKNSSAYFPYVGSGYSQELLAYGISVSEWKMAIDVEWHWGDQDGADTWFDYDAYMPNRVRQYYGEDFSTSRNIFWRGNFTVAHPIGDDYVMGVRIGGSQWDNSSSKIRETYSNYYWIEEEPPELRLSDESYLLYTNEDIARITRMMLQIGILRRSDRGMSSGISMLVSMDKLHSRTHRNDFRTISVYDNSSEIDLYEYEDLEWRDKRYGDLWAFHLQGHHIFPLGIRLFMEGGFALSDYKTDWRDHLDYLRWGDYYVSREVVASTAFSGEGSFKEINYLAKIGRTTRIMRNLEVTTGLYGFYEKEWSDENPLVEDRAVLNIDTEGLEFTGSRRTTISYETETSGIACPIAIEYKPSKYFSFFSGFVVKVTWEKNTEEFNVPEVYDIIQHPGSLYNNIQFVSFSPTNTNQAQTSDRNVDERLSSSRQATLGFSLHYQDRLFVDVYTGTNVLPDHLSSLIVDLRYKF